MGRSTKCAVSSTMDSSAWEVAGVFAPCAVWRFHPLQAFHWPRRHLTYRVMNAPMSVLPSKHSGNPEVPWFSYGILPGASTQLEVLKMHVRFDAFATFMDLGDHVEPRGHARRERSAPWKLPQGGQAGYCQC
jgi:hypothetical protein